VRPSRREACGPELSPLRLLVATLLVIVLSTIGCAVRSSLQKPIPDRKQVAGSWNGWMWSRVSGATQRVTLMIPSDGPYQVIMRGGTMHLGQLTMTGEVLRYSHGSGFWNGTVELVEEGGKEYLSLLKTIPGCCGWSASGRRDAPRSFRLRFLSPPSAPPPASYACRPLNVDS
jgi:hypothetical protein